MMNLAQQNSCYRSSGEVLIKQPSHINRVINIQSSNRLSSTQVAQSLSESVKANIRHTWLHDGTMLLCQLLLLVMQEKRNGKGVLRTSKMLSAKLVIDGNRAGSSTRGRSREERSRRRKIRRRKSKDCTALRPCH